jgi:hypothetical protein
MGLLGYEMKNCQQHMTQHANEKGKKVCEERQLGIHGMDGEIIIHEIIVIIIGKEK